MFLQRVFLKHLFISHLASLLDPTVDSAAIVVESLADAVTHARFVGTDSGSDEVVLMKILHASPLPK